MLRNVTTHWYSSELCSRIADITGQGKIATIVGTSTENINQQQQYHDKLNGTGWVGFASSFQCDWSLQRLAGKGKSRAEMFTFGGDQSEHSIISTFRDYAIVQ